MSFRVEGAEEGATECLEPIGSTATPTKLGLLTMSSLALRKVGWGAIRPGLLIEV